MKKTIIILVMMITAAVTGQTKDPNKLLDAVRQKFNKVIDYKADASVKLDMSFIKVPEMKAKIYFKKPDKIKVEADGFAMLPKQGLNFSPADLLNEDFTAIYVRSENIDNRRIDVVKAIPTSDSSGVILSTLWIDAAESVIRKVETTRKKGGTTQIELNYDNYQFGLPSQIKLTFNLGDVQMPENPAPQQAENTDSDKKNRRRMGLPKNESLKGNVIMVYKNYQVNKGIPDNFFSDSQKDKKVKID